MSEDGLTKHGVNDIPLHCLNMKQLIELDACTRCGECQLWCPVYDQDARESIIPRRKVIDFLKIAKTQQGFLSKLMHNEKISASLKGMLRRIFRYKEIGKAEIDDFVQNLYECSTCGQCEVVCPAHIETVTLWEELRRAIVQAGHGPLEVQKALVKSVKSFDNPWQQPRAARTKWARRAKKDGLIQALPRQVRKTKPKVLLFLGCTAAYDVNVKQVAINTLNILEALDIDYGILGSEEKCCASVLLRMGDPEHERVFKENIDLFNGLGIETLISSCSGCFKTIKQDYPRVAPINFKVMHTVEFLAGLLQDGKLEFPHPVERTVTYHDPCHLGRAAGGFDAPRIIMDAIPGLKLVEMPRNREYSRCCGAGGGLKAGFPDIQNKMAQRRIQEAMETNAEQLISCCPFCFQGLNIGIMGLKSQIVMKDISSLVAESILGYDVFEKAGEKAEADIQAREAKKAVREKRRADRAALKEDKSADVESVPATVETVPDRTNGAALIEDRAAKKTEKERKRAERRVARRKPKADAVDARVAETKPQADDLSRSTQKIDKEQRRAKRRAAREKEKAARQAVRRKPKADAVDAKVAETKSQADDDSRSTQKIDKEQRRAERRAVREKEKAARQAARRKGKAE